MQQQLDVIRDQIAADSAALRAELDDARAELRAARAEIAQLRALTLARRLEPRSSITT
jgi:hypothetical protein